MTEKPFTVMKQSICYHAVIIRQGVSNGYGTPGKRGVNLETRLEQFNGLGSTSLRRIFKRAALYRLLCRFASKLLRRANVERPLLMVASAGLIFLGAG